MDMRKSDIPITYVFCHHSRTEMPVAFYRAPSFSSNAGIFSSGRVILSTIILFMLRLTTPAQDPDSVTIFIQQYEFQKVLDKINEKDEKNSDIQLLDLKATALKGLNRYREAIPVYEKLLKNDTSNLGNIIDLANCYQSTGDYKNAQQYYRKALTLSPQNIYLYQQLADALYQDEDYQNAIVYYAYAHTEHSSGYLSKQLARCFDNLERTDTAIYYYQQAITVNPFDSQTAYRLANLYRQKEDYVDALDVTGSYLSHDSTNVKMLKLDGYLNFLNKDFTGAINSFRKCISLKDTSAFTNKYLGYSLFKVKEYQEAKDYLEKAFLEDTTNIELCYTLGLSCDYSVYKKAGIDYLSRTIELATPSSLFLSQVYQDLAVANTGFYKYEEALDAYLKAYELNPGDTLLIFRIASHYDNWIKDREKALEYYQVFMTTRPKNKRSVPFQ